MFRRYSKTIAAVVLCFFTWASGGVFSVAHAAQDAVKKGKAKEQQQKKADGPDERFAKTTEELQEALADPKADVETKKQRLKAAKAELEALDPEIRKQFAETEKRLKDAKLPDEILQRHYKFVKHYDDNLAELKGNIDKVEKAKDKAEAEAEIDKAAKHLKKVKAEKKHKPLDPNNLPHRIRKVKERQPKQKTEEWEKELNKAPKKSKVAQRLPQKPILVAANGPLTGLLSGSITQDSNSSYSHDVLSSNSLADIPSTIALQSQLEIDKTTSLLQTAAAESNGKYPYPEDIYPLPWKTDMTAEDKMETPETHVTDAIRAKAAELQNNPISIFNWLYNNIYLVPTYGSIQGADMCLQTRHCNATDIASLTIALFRAADWPARYEFVTKELTIDKFMENMGSFTDPMAAIDFAASGGIPVRPVISAGKITAVQFEHVYATALLPEGFAIGAVMKKGWSRPMWIPLDVSLKHYVTTQGVDIKAAVPFDAQSFVNQIQSTATINETGGYVTHVNSALVQQTMQDYQKRVQDYISLNAPTATVGDVLGKREIQQKNFPILPVTTWSKNVTGRVQSHTLPDSMRHKLTFNVKNDTVDLTSFDPDAPPTADTTLNITKSLAELAGKKITLSYSPATPQDEAVINSYLPKPHADGTPIQPSELPSSLPAYLINVKPELRIDGQVVATGAPVGLGGTNIFTMTFSDPSYGSSQVVNYIDAGVYQAIGLNLGMISQHQLAAIKAKLESTSSKIKNKDFTNLTKDDVVGELLHTTALAYHARLGTMNYVAAKTAGVNALTLPSETIFATKLRVLTLWGIPTLVQPGGLNMDADYLMQVVKAKDGNADSVIEYMLSSGMTSSTLEHSLPEELFSTSDSPAQGVSTIKAMKIANDQGIPIYTVNQASIDTILPQLQIGSEVKSDIQNAVNAGKAVTVPKSNISYNGWIGCGYIITNPETGAGAYMISGGTNGAVLMTYISMFVTYSAWGDAWNNISDYWVNAYENMDPCTEMFISCWGSCVEKHRFDTVASLTALGSALPKKLLPPFRVVNMNQRLTTLLSVLAHYTVNDIIASSMRSAGRAISRVATPLTIAEGLYDIGVISYCASDCEANTCSQ